MRDPRCEMEDLQHQAGNLATASKRYATPVPGRSAAQTANSRLTLFRLRVGINEIHFPHGIGRRFGKQHGVLTTCDAFAGRRPPLV